MRKTVLCLAPLISLLALGFPQKSSRDLPGAQRAQAAELIQKAQGELKRRDFPQAAKYFRSLTELIPDNAQAHLGLATALMGMRDLSGAYAALEKAARLAPDDLNISLARAKVEASLGQLEKARRTLAKARSMSPNDPRVELRSIEVELAANQTAEVLQQAKDLSKAHPGNPSIHAYLGSLLMSANLLEAAAEELELARKLDPSQEPYALELAEVWVRLDRDREALGLLRPLKTGTSQREQPGRFYLLLARAELGSGHLPAALESIEKAIQDQPKDPASWLLLALIQLESQQASEVETALQEAIALAPTSLKLHAGALTVYVEKEEYEAGRRFFTRLSKEHPENPLFLVDLLRLNVSGKDTAKVKEVLRSAARRFPSDGQLHKLLGQVLYSEELEALALAEFLRAHQSGMTDSEVALQLARLGSRAGAFRDAMERGLSVVGKTDLAASIRAAAASVVGESHAAVGETEKAVEYLKLAVELGPEIDEFYISLARVHENAADNGAASTVLRKGLNRIPDSGDLRLALGLNLIALGDFDGAIEVLEELTERFPDRLEAYRPLADAYTSSGNSEASTETLRRLHGRQPDYPMIQVLLAQSLLEQGAPQQEVLSLLEGARKASPSDAEIYLLLGRIYNSMGRAEDALVELKRAVELQPASPTYRYQLGLIYHRLGKEELAEEQFARKAHLERVDP